MAGTNDVDFKAVVLAVINACESTRPRLGRAKDHEVKPNILSSHSQRGSDGKFTPLASPHADAAIAKLCYKSRCAWVPDQ